MITQDELKKLFNYCEKTGDLIRKTGNRQGIAANTINDSGYLRIEIKGKKYRVHRLVWIFVHGSIDSNLQIDHISGVRSDNRIKNLRLVDKSENMRNQKKSCNNKSGAVGVSWDKNSAKWKVNIGFDGKKAYLGLFADKDEAIKARKAAEIEYGYHKNHGRD